MGSPVKQQRELPEERRGRQQGNYSKSYSNNKYKRKDNTMRSEPEIKLKKGRKIQRKKIGNKKENILISGIYYLADQD